MGEAVIDVSTHAPVPTMVLQSQYQVASAIKVSNVRLGGLGGCTLLIAACYLHFSLPRRYVAPCFAFGAAAGETVERRSGRLR